MDSKEKQIVTKIIFNFFSCSGINGKKVAALLVFAYSLQFIKNAALHHLSDQCGIQILDEDVRWIITVPAIWRQKAKQFMRMAAYQAGLASPDDPNRLLISPEPEAAAIYCRKLKIDQQAAESTIVRSERISPDSGKDSLKSNDNNTIYLEKGIRKREKKNDFFSHLLIVFIIN